MTLRCSVQGSLGLKNGQVTVRRPPGRGRLTRGRDRTRYVKEKG